MESNRWRDGKRGYRSRPNLHKKRVPSSGPSSFVQSSTPMALSNGWSQKSLFLYTCQKLTCPLDGPFCRSDTVFRGIKWLNDDRGPLGSSSPASRGTRGPFNTQARLSTPPPHRHPARLVLRGTPRASSGADGSPAQPPSTAIGRCCFRNQT